MRSLWPLLLLVGCSAHTNGPEQSQSGICREGDSTSYLAGNGTCTVIRYCSGGTWHENGDDCWYKSRTPTCATVGSLPTGCGTSALKCSWPCANGTVHGACRNGVWVTSVCNREGITGAPCGSTVECDPRGLDLGVCSNASPFASSFSMPVCLATGCRTSGSTFPPCDGDRGLCLRDGACLPACRFDDTGAAPEGCSGRTACHAVRWEEGRGTGYCLGACETDADCPATRKCDEKGDCVAAPTTPKKALGEACVEGECVCTSNGTASQCVQACRVDGIACKDGFACDPQLDPAMTKAPAGIAGYCQKTCTTDLDCAPGVKCIQHGGMTVKTCTVGGSF